MIYVSQPDIGELELEYTSEAVSSGWVSSIGKYVTRFEKEFSAYCDCQHGIAVTNGTDALVLALRALNVSRGDEVIIPSHTFAAVAASVKIIGAEPVIVDVDPEYWCIDPYNVEKAISSKTKAIIAVHSYGHPADMDAILALANKADIPVIEDCAEAHGARYKNKKVGSIGSVGCFSFYGNKIITTGEGGMLVTNDDTLNDRIRFLKDHAMLPGRRYYHTEVGYNKRMTNIQAALGCAQMKRIKEFLSHRARILEWYKEDLEGIDGIQSLNPKMKWANPVNWMTSILLDNQASKMIDEISSRLLDKGVDTRPFFIPISNLPPYKDCLSFSRKQGVNISDHLGRSGLNLPTYNQLTREQVSYCSQSLIEAIK